MIHYDTTAIEAVNDGRDTPDAFYAKSTLMATSHWHSTDGWRGHTELTAEPGFMLVGEGCNTGSWSDTPAGTSDDEVQAELRDLEEKYGELWVVFTPTSNVFSTGWDAIARDPENKPLKGKTIAHKTKRYELPDGSWYVQYHATKVVSYDAKTGKYRLDTGGWNTMTTGKRMTDALPSGYFVCRQNWIMYLGKWVDGERELVPIEDGMEVYL